MSTENGATVKSTDEIVAFLDERIQEIKARDKKSDYHTAKRRAYETVRNLIAPPAAKAPKAERVPKEKKVKAATAPATTEADTQVYEPAEQAA